LINEIYNWPISMAARMTWNGKAGETRILRNAWLHHIPWGSPVWWCSEPWILNQWNRCS